MRTVPGSLNPNQLALPIFKQPQAPVDARSLSVETMPLASGYAGEDRNASARELTVRETMGWSQKATDLIVAYPPVDESVAADMETETLSASEQARRHLAALGLKPTDPATRPEVVWRNHVNIYSR